MAAILGGVALAFAVWRFREFLARRLGRLTLEETELARRQISGDYASAAHGLARRFRPRHAWETPDEWLRAANAAVPQLALEPLQILTDLYVRARFSPLELSAHNIQQSQRARAEIVWPKKRILTFWQREPKQ